jgi:hypothetical protein
LFSDVVIFIPFCFFSCHRLGLPACRIYIFHMVDSALVDHVLFS